MDKITIPSHKWLQSQIGDTALYQEDGGLDWVDKATVQVMESILDACLVLSFFQLLYMEAMNRQ